MKRLACMIAATVLFWFCMPLIWAALNDSVLTGVPALLALIVFASLYFRYADQPRLFIVKRRTES